MSEKLNIGTSDTAGIGAVASAFSSSFNKVVDTIGKGIGTIYEPLNIVFKGLAEAKVQRIQADSEAYKISVIEKAKSDAALSGNKELTI